LLSQFFGPFLGRVVGQRLVSRLPVLGYGMPAPEIDRYLLFTLARKARDERSSPFGLLSVAGVEKEAAVVSRDDYAVPERLAQVVLQLLRVEKIELRVDYTVRRESRSAGANRRSSSVDYRDRKVVAHDDREEDRVEAVE
jgi:hypothetical protein